MPAFRSLRKPILVILAILFAAATVLYSAVWMYNTRRQLSVELGFDNRHIAAEHCELVNSVVPGLVLPGPGRRAWVEWGWVGIRKCGAHLCIPHHAFIARRFAPRRVETYAVKG